MREIVFDTETTGFEPGEGHRIVEIGCVELVDHFPTGRTLQIYLNPERDVPIESQRVHGLSGEFLADKPLFGHVVDEFLEFLGDAPLVIHNASFDIKFINAELNRVGRSPIPLARAVDTIEIAKRKIPGARYSLDELCKRFGVDLSARSKHGALLVDAVGNPDVVPQLDRPSRDLPALRPHATHGKIEIGDFKIVKPERDWRAGDLVEHTAHRPFTGGEELIGLYWSSHGLRLLPTQQPAVELERRSCVGGE